ncbi:hypothetical protein ACFWAZ_09925 [Streptomyces collinus]|uniref:Mu transposase domain-containing protein n=1 Tax=Streptomyces collinus TaxID=42684 RepID=UPI00365D8CDD
MNPVTVRCNSYSVPVRFMGRRRRVSLHANGLVVSDGRTVDAHHERLSGRAEPPGTKAEPAPGRAPAAVSGGRGAVAAGPRPGPGRSA